METKTPKFITIPMPAPLEHALRMTAAELEISRSELTRRFCIDGLKRLKLEKQEAARERQPA